MSIEPRIRVLVVARDQEIRRRIAAVLGARGETAFDIEEVADAPAAGERLSEGAVDVTLLRLQPPDGLDGLRAVSAAAPDVPIVAVLATGGPDASRAAREAGAVDSIAEDRIEAEVLRRALGFAVERTRLQREVHRNAVVDPLTGVYNARGFEQLAEHQLRIADRTGEAVVLVLVRVEGGAEGDPASSALIADTAAVLREAVRDADVVGRLGVDAFGVVLTGGANGKEGVVLARIVEGVATRNARAGAQRLSVVLGSATYDERHRASLPDLIRRADERMRSSRPSR